MNIYIVFKVMDEGADAICDVFATEEAAEEYAVYCNRMTCQRFYVSSWEVKEGM